MHNTILVPLDGSLESESALPYARLLANKCGSSLELFRSFEPLSTTYGLPDLSNLASDILAEERLQQMIQEYLDLKTSELAGLTCDTRVVCGHPAESIMERCPAVDLVLMSRHGRSGSGRWRMGGTTAKVVRGSAKPVLVVPGDKSLAEPRLEHILVCLDGSAPALKALAEAARLARALGARLTLYQAVPLMGSEIPDMTLDEAREQIEKCEKEYSDLVSATVVQPTATGAHISQCAQDLKTDMVVVGSHGRRGLARWILGSVAEQTLQQVSVPLLVVH